MTGAGIAAAAAGVAVGSTLVLALLTRAISRRTAERFPNDGHFVQVGDDRLHYVEYGRADQPAIVLVHGLCGQLRNYAYLDLKRLSREYRVIAVDRPGSGKSTRGAASTANVYAQARTIAGFIEKLGLDRPVLIGHSLGGAIALAVGLDYPHCVRRLGLIAPLTMTETSAPGPFKGLQLQWRPLRRLASLTMGVPLMALINRKAVSMVFAPERVPNDFGLKGGGASGLQSSVFYAASSDLCSAPEDLPDMARRYAAMSVPVDMLFGREDKILPFGKHAEGLKRLLPGVNLRAVPGGHMLPVTQAAKTTDWIKGVAAAGFARKAEKAAA